MDERLRQIARALRDRTPRQVWDGPSRAGDPQPGPVALASVALVVQPGVSDLELLLIRRAVAPGDPWSGHMALPGGRRSPEDADGLATAVRETREEVGVDLDRYGEVLGRLDTVQPRSGTPRIAVSPYVFAVPRATAVQPNHEVDLALWVPVGELAAPGAATEYLHALSSGEHLRFPAIGYQEHVIWGLTYRILQQFLATAPARPEQGEHGE